mmetsp:Transcript_25741/g.55392  ORF Transcript_25741/g.55392 Transcript_25741/m.55392 type:complete len:211 (-) Transcript_25741:174-806(-)
MAEWGEMEFLVLDHGRIGGINGCFDGIDSASARLKKELTLEHEEDVEVVVLFGAFLVPRFGGVRFVGNKHNCGCGCRTFDSRGGCSSLNDGISSGSSRAHDYRGGYLGLYRRVRPCDGTMFGVVAGLVSVGNKNSCGCSCGCGCRNFVSRGGRNSLDYGTSSDSANGTLSSCCGDDCRGGCLALCCRVCPCKCTLEWAGEGSCMRSSGGG